MNSRVGRIAGAVALLALLATAAPGLAQNGPPARGSGAEETPVLPPQTVVGERQPGAATEPPPSTAPTEPTVVTPSLVETGVSQIGSQVTVITAEQIERSGQRTVADVLRSVPGVDVVQQAPTGLDVVRLGNQGGVTSVFIRGANSQHTKVFLDGIPINDPSTASRAFDFSVMSVDNTERIEVLRGPQGTLYGSDAIGGVIQIITRRGEGPLSVDAVVEGGHYGTHREGAVVSGGTAAYDYSISGSYFHTDGFSAASEERGNVEDDAFDLGTAAGRFGYRPDEQTEVEFLFRWTDADAEIDDAGFLGTPATDDLVRRNLTEQFFGRVGLSRSQFDGLLVHKLGFNFADHERSDLDDVFPAEFAGQTRELEYQLHAALTEWNLLIVGAEYLAEESTTSDVFTPTTFRTQNDSACFAEDRLQLTERWLVTLGLRFDEHSEAGDADTYRATSLYDLHETGTVLRGSYGTGFRAPALAELPFAPSGFLRPELSEGWDLGLEQWLLSDVLVVSATYFRNEFVDLIVFDPSQTPPGFPFGILANVGQARAHGVELAGLWHSDARTHWNVSYTRTDTRDEDFDLPLVRRPQHKGTAGVTRDLAGGRAAISLYALLVGDRLDSRDGTVELDPYGLLNLAGHYDLTQRLRLFARVDNLTDTRYEEVTGFGTAGASLFGGARYRW